MEQTNFESYIRGKRVALVGNAASLLSTQYGSEIDDHDVVIRINTPAIFYDALTPRHSHGTRIHVWAFWDYFRYKTSDHRNKPQRLLDTFFDSDRYNILNLNMTNKKNEGFVWNDDEFFFDVKQRCLQETGNPSAGLVLLYLLNECDPAVVNVYGFDFKRTPTFSNFTYDVDENRFDNFFRHDYAFEETYARQKFFTQERFNLKGDSYGTYS